MGIGCEWAEVSSIKLPREGPITDPAFRLIDISAGCPNTPGMSDTIYPRSPRETMCGWMHLPRYIDKIRLQLAGRLAPAYQGNLGKGFDEGWLKAAGLTHEQFVEVVRNSITDGEVADWVLKHVHRTEEEKAAHRAGMFNYPAADDARMQERLALRKKESGLEDRHDIQTFVDYIDADEGRK
jgi:hypothetical protein